MEKQTSIYLSENDLKKLAYIKQQREIKQNSDIIKTLINEDFLNIQKYKNIL